MDSINIVYDSIGDSLTIFNPPMMLPIEVQCASENGWWNILTWILSFIFSALTFYVGRITARKNEIKNDEIKEVDRKMSLFKTLILDYNLRYVYVFFEQLDNQLRELKQPNCDKKLLDSHIQNEFKKLNEKFVELLMAVDNDYYESMLKLSDKYRDKLVSNIADDGVNLYVESKYSELIDSPCREFKVLLLKSLFNYRGESNHG